MTTIIFLIEQLSPGIFILCLVGILWNGRKLLVVRREYRATRFELERDLSRNRQGNLLTTIILLFEFILIVLGIQLQVAPTIRNIQPAEVAVINTNEIEDGEYATFTPAAPQPVDIAPVPPIGEEETIIQATPTLTPTPVGTIVPNPPPSVGCDEPGATLEIPVNGLNVFQVIPVRGTAFADNFAFYKIEIRGPGTLGSYIVLDTRQNPITETAELYQFNPAPFEPGAYEFRLAVFDITQTLRASCMVNINIIEPPPTPTPITQQ